jgi:hypothetical protein
MTLQDKDVLAEDDDVLVNVNMIDDEKFEKVWPKCITLSCYSITLCSMYLTPVSHNAGNISSVFK